MNKQINKRIIKIEIKLETGNNKEKIFKEMSKQINKKNYKDRNKAGNG